MKKKVLSNSQWKPSPRRKLPSTHACGKGDSQPPMKSSAESAEIRIMFAYSARKKTAKAIPEYSTWKPATISDSPSATSKGARLVSAIPEIR
jgi:hypothetical protein